MYMVTRRRSSDKITPAGTAVRGCVSSFTLRLHFRAMESILHRELHLRNPPREVGAGNALKLSVHGEEREHGRLYVTKVQLRRLAAGGVIGFTDFLALLVQFGHTCAGP